jgi:hypothetical protein
MQMTLNFTCHSQRLVFLATSLFLKLLFQMSFLSLAFRSNSRSKLISPTVRRPNNVTHTPVDSARNLCVIPDKNLSFLNTFHLFRNPASSIFVIYGVFSIYGSRYCIYNIATSLIHSKLDYYNALLLNLPASQINRLQLHLFSTLLPVPSLELQNCII